MSIKNLASRRQFICGSASAIGALAGSTLALAPSWAQEEEGSDEGSPAALPEPRMFQDELYTEEELREEELKEFSPELFGPRAAPRTDFDKLFNLPSFGDGLDEQELKKNLRQLGARGGRFMDARDPPVTISNPLDGNEGNNPDNSNPDMTVGFTFLGQFIDHDLTFDPARLDDPNPPQVNHRTPFLDLDSVYGSGPWSGNRNLYNSRDRAKFRIEFRAPRDLPRDANQGATIRDPRNDENVIISQLHLAFLRFHNEVVDWVRANTPQTRVQATFREAQKLVRWHYQYVIVEQFLRATLRPDIYNDIKTNGPRYFKISNTPKMPREFQTAAYRFGHSQIRPGYKINNGFGAPIFDIAINSGVGDPNDLRGGRRAERRFIEWDTFFDFGTQEIAIDENGAVVVRDKVKLNKRIDPFLSSPMLSLPVATGTVLADEENSLASRNLLRHLQHQLPSGQRVASEIGAPVLTFNELQELNFHDNTPLWYYVLGEALRQTRGERLGQVGSTIVGEVFFGLLSSDPNSYWSSDRNWQPVFPKGRNPKFPNTFTMTDLLTFARVA